VIFQSRFNKHTFVVRPTRVAIDPVHGVRTPLPGLIAEFDRFTRLFDSEDAQQKHGWSDEERVAVEDWLLGNKAFGKDIFLAPGELQKLDEATVAKMRVKPAVKVRRCIDLRIVKGQVFQCDQEATAGRDYCKAHDPQEPRIVKGAVEQK